MWRAPAWSQTSVPSANQKHYFIGTDEVEKLLRKGEGWLEDHPEREVIVRRYLGGFGALVRHPTQVAIFSRMDASATAEAA